MAFDPAGSGYGLRPRSDRDLNEIMAVQDREEDITVASGDTDLTSGNLPTGEARNKYYARVLYNLSLTAAMTVKYHVLGDQTLRSIGIAPCGSFVCAQPILIIAGTSEGATAGSLKIMYKDRAVVDGDSHSRV
jgi:hypothetical protein